MDADPSPCRLDAAAVDALMRRGESLATTPRESIDLRWHVQAMLLGDFAALALARARSEPVAR